MGDTLSCGIYSITDSASRTYIGSSSNLAKRWTQHQYFLNKGTHCNFKLQNAWNTLQKGLKFTILLICRPEDLLMYEQQYIDFYKPEYNICQFVDKSRFALGVKRSALTKERISLALKGKLKKIRHKMSEETKDKIRAKLIGNSNGIGNKANLGKKLPKSVCLKMGDSKRGKSISEKQKLFLSESRKGAGNPMFGKTPWNKKIANG